MLFSKLLKGSKSAITSCFNRIDFVVIPSYIELPCLYADDEIVNISKHKYISIVLHNLI